MGRPKALLPIDQNETFLSRIVRVLVTAGVDEVVVVAGDVGLDDVHVALKATEKMPRVVVNPDPTRGQLSSLLVGLETVQTLLDTYKSARAPIVRPTRLDDSEHGHPVIFDRELFTKLRQASLSEGAKPVVRSYEHVAVNVPVDDEGAFADIDTPSDYERLTGRPFPRENRER